MSFSIRQLNQFVAIAETGQISRAALRCHVSQSTITIALKNLEETIGDQIFTRHPRGLQLTESGERFLRHAKKILFAVDDAIQDMKQVPTCLAGDVRICVTETITQYLLPTLLKDASRRFPNIKIEYRELEQDRLENVLLSGDFDFGVFLISNSDPLYQLEYETMVRSPRKLWISPDHPLVNKDPVCLADLENDNFILLDVEGYKETAMKFWQKHGLVPNIRHRSQSIEAVRSLVALGFGVTILSDFVFRPWSIDGNRIIRKDLSDDIPCMSLGVARPKIAPLSETAQTVLESLRTYVKAMSGYRF